MLPKLINLLDEAKFFALLSWQKFIPLRNVSLQLLQLQAELLDQMLFSTILRFLCVRLIRLNALHSNFLLGNTNDVVLFCRMSLTSRRVVWFFVLLMRKQLRVISFAFASFWIPNGLVISYLWKVLLHELEKFDLSIIGLFSGPIRKWLRSHLKSNIVLAPVLFTAVV